MSVVLDNQMSSLKRHDLKQDKKERRGKDTVIQERKDGEGQNLKRQERKDRSTGQERTIEDRTEQNLDSQNRDV
jgi:hypothetical protein